MFVLIEGMIFKIFFFLLKLVRDFLERFVVVSEKLSVLLLICSCLFVKFIGFFRKVIIRYFNFFFFILVEIVGIF